MIAYTERAVDRAIANKWAIMVEDRPAGIPLAALRHLHKRGYKRLNLISVAGQPLKAIDVLNQEGEAESVAVDLGMCKTVIELGDSSMFIWDGKDKAIKALYEHALSYGLKCWLVDFSQKDPHTSLKPLVTAHEPDMRKREPLTQMAMF